MAPKKGKKTKPRKSGKSDIPAASSQKSNSSNTRSKKYTTNECEVLMKLCEKFHAVINKNSNRDEDKKQKTKAWETIKKGFDFCCKADGMFVSTILYVLFNL